MLLPHIPLDLQPQQVAACLGVGNKQPVEPRWLARVQEMINLGKCLMQPAAVAAHMQLAPDGATLYRREASFNLPWPGSYLENCSTASVVTVTVGETIEKEVTGLFSQGLAADAVLLDAVGTAAVEEAARRVVRLLAGRQRSKGLFPAPRLGPGYRGLPMDCLPLFLQMSGAEQIAVACNEYYQMQPAKSLCFMVGWCPRPTQKQVKCQSCQMTNCRMRQANAEGESELVF
ncbi:Vitamin B12 dependent methionine synthase,activation region [Desulforamulus hydrothermalis]|uniref:Vitamin B12 dependent methionine synthase,activation region n=1 Tax=Desulforamulus hydrothermalis Lam5 = DSM 18033 TaxID=1121428 RepID=K8DX15_9FIRM|nr:Vitamin B12 dependent methionine synthase,activation region [Desulforamulus hydrothermalis]CCO06945.1 Vitamin B12 dependent methionine synthase,activation region [Desulforamulus hydrothermalis Lam5 = DSM 18033]SHG99050.1 hypothetical protein SAMN02745177_01044 [Desulforamulus hydrothermalis Lam5 = DSM 18033]